MAKFSVTGMSCAACSARVEKAVGEVAGVTKCEVNLLTNSMVVEGTASVDSVVSAVVEAGYGASLQESASDDQFRDTETPKLLRRLVTSIVLWLPLMYVSMGHMMWNFPLPSIIADNHTAMSAVQLVLCVAVMLVNRKFFLSGFRGLIHRAPNMDTLVALGSGAAFLYSTYSLVAMAIAQHAGDMVEVLHLMDNLYFESAATILTLITVGKTLESHSKGRTTSALKGLVSLAPKTATVLRSGSEVEVPVSEVVVGDIFLLRPGQSVPVDGVVLEGSSAVDESNLTGESVPVDKVAGDSVSTATTNCSGFLKCEATRVGEDTTLSQIVKLVADASASKAPIARIADRVSGVFVPVVMAIALVTFVAWLFIAKEFPYALGRGIAVLVISCPCALGLATPVAIMVGNGVGAKSGILFKTATSLEETGKVQIVALDKTGTITRGTPELTDLVPVDCTEEELLKLAGALEVSSEHPLAKAVVKHCEELGLTLPQATDFEALVGSGVTAKLDGVQCYGGSYKFIASRVSVQDTVTESVKALAEAGKTPLLFTKGDTLLGILALADTVKPDSKSAVKTLQNMGIKVVMLTGDNSTTARAVGEEVGVDLVAADLLPRDKERVIAKLSEQGKVAMVGDGVNDAPALTRADIGIAIGAGADVAVSAASVVLVNNSLTDVAAAIRLSRKTLLNIHENLFWAFIYNVIGIPLAAGVFGLTLNPMFAAAAMSLSSFCVVSNALRLNLTKVYNFKREKHRKGVDITLELGDDIVTKKFDVQGMMCPHCEASVKKALEAVEGVSTASADHTTGVVEVTLTAPVEDSVLKATITDAGYTVL